MVLNKDLVVYINLIVVLNKDLIKVFLFLVWVLGSSKIYSDLQFPSQALQVRSNPVSSPYTLFWFVVPSSLIKPSNPSKVSFHKPKRK